jgi:hypothetical protein
MPSPFGLINGMDQILKVICQPCRKKAEAAIEKWMADQFDQDMGNLDRRARKKKRPLRLVKDS